MRTSTVSAGVVILLLTVAPRAEANVWDWIHELSGPGKSKTQGAVVYSDCFDSLRTAPMTRPCLFLDWQSYRNLDDDNFPNSVRFDFYDVGVTWKLHRSRAIEVGAGIGLVRFSSDDQINDTDDKVTTNRVTVILPRLVLAPGALFFDRSASGTGARIARVFKLYGRQNIIPGTIDATDFGVRLGTGEGESTFTEDNDRPWSYGLIFDFGELLFR
jgi:hypothetical protein